MPIDIMYVVAGLAALLFICVFTMSYIKAAPDEAIIVSGLRKEPRVSIGRAGFRIPFFERADHLSLQLIQIDVKTGSPVPTKDYINVSVDAVVTASEARFLHLVDEFAFDIALIVVYLHLRVATAKRREAIFHRF